MRSRFASFGSVLFSCLFLALVVGCPKQPGETDAPPDDALRGVNRHATNADPMVLPLEPVTGETSFLHATGSGKIGAAAEDLSFPPVSDLIAQAEEYLTKIGRALDDLDGTRNYQRDSDHVVRDAHALALVALSIGLCPEDSKLKKASPKIIKAAKALAAVESYADAKKNYDILKEASTDEGDPQTLVWSNGPALGPAMKAVPNLDSTIKRLSSNEARMKREKNITRITGPLAGLAAIAQGCMSSVKETIKPDAEAEWIKESILFRNAAIKANAAAHAFAEGKSDYAAYSAAYEELSATCETCHAVFHPQ